MNSRLSTCVPLLLLASPALADVLTVGPSGADFPTIQLAVDAAAPGDLVLVAASATPYAGFSVAGKGIAVVGRSWFQTGTGSIRISDVPAGQTFVLRDFGVDAVDAPAIEIARCLGPVRVENSYGNLFLAGDAPTFAACVSIVDCSDFAASELQTNIVDSVGSLYTAIGMRIEGSRFVAFGGHFQGARGPHGSGLGGVLLDGGDGTPAIEALGSTLFLNRLYMTGGFGGLGLSACNLPTIHPTNGGDGAPALALLAGTAILRHVALDGGSPGQGGHAVGACSAGSNGSHGAPMFDPTGGVTLLPTAGRTLRTQESVVREGESLHVHVDALPGDVVYLGLARQTGIGYTPLIEGEPLVIAPVLRRLAGTAGFAGISATIPLGELGVGIEGRILYVQAVVFSTDGHARWTNLSTVAHIDAAL